MGTRGLAARGSGGWIPGLAGVLALCLMGGAALGQEDPEGSSPTPLEGTVAAPQRSLLPIAVPALKNSGGGGDPGGVGAMMGQVIGNDLYISGFFKVIDPRAYIADPRQEGYTSGTINFKPWLNVGAMYLIKGGYGVTGDRLWADIRLFEVGKGSQILGKVFKGGTKDARVVAHKFADAIVRHFTGEPSIFLTRIAMTMKSRRGKEIGVMDFDGHGATAITGFGSLAMFPAWSPGGGLAYSVLQGSNWNLLMGKRVISKYDGMNTGASFGPGGQIAITLTKDGNAEIYIISTSGSIINRVTNHFADDLSPAWSPDGSRIAFVSNRAGSPQIYVTSPGGGGAERVTFQGTYNQSPSWSPDGDKIAFCARDERFRFDIFYLDLAGGGVHRVTQDQGNNESPSWAPNGRYLCFSSTRDGSGKIYIATPDGTHQVRVSPPGGSHTDPAWGPGPRK